MSSSRKSTGRQHAPTQGKNISNVSAPVSAKLLPGAVTGPPGAPLSEDRLLFSFREIDEGGKWSPCSLANTHTKRLFRKLASLGALTPAEARQSGLLSALSMDKCKNDSATARLANQYDGLDVLHEIRIEPSQAARLHGRLVGNVFNIIWWDPKHEVWPEGKQVK